MSMGNYGQHDQPYECDGCESTVLCTPVELVKQYGWKRHGSSKHKNKSKAKWTLLLCDDCNAKAGK